MKNDISAECTASVICPLLVRQSHRSSIHHPRTLFHTRDLGTNSSEHLTFSFRPQVQDSLNPNNLEYWMEDIYTPGYDSLLKRKEAEFRRAKACKIGALIAAAACTVILVIVVPICTMKS